MNRIVLALGVSVLLACAGCDRVANAPAERPDGSDATTQRIATLEARVAELERRNSDLALKGRIVGSQLFGSPLDNFFASDEFWQNTYDSGQADCAKRCIATLTAERKACEAIDDDVQQQRCYEDASARASQCQTQCSANNPPPIP